MDTIRELLDTELKSQIENLARLDSGSKEMTAAVEDVNKLYRLRLEEDKTALDYKERRAKRISENAQHREETELKKAQVKLEADAQLNEVCFKDTDKKAAFWDRIVKIGISAGETLIPLAAYAAFFVAGLKFEETGTFGSSTFKNFLHVLKPKK